MPEELIEAVRRYVEGVGKAHWTYQAMVHRELCKRFGYDPVDEQIARELAALDAADEQRRRTA